MKTRIKTGKVSLIVFMAVMAVCVAGVAIWCHAVGYQVKEHRQGGSVTWVEYTAAPTIVWMVSPVNTAIL